MLKRFLYISLIILITKSISAQCPLIYDYLGNLVTQPYFVSCTGAPNYSVNFASNTGWGAYSINWGDGSTNTVAGSYPANTIITHNYNSVLPDTFVITLTTSAPNCTLTGVVVMEKPVNASIQIPVGGVTTACAPKVLQFLNSSTDVSETTTFTWNFGDGSPAQTFSYTNAGQIVSHNYLPGTVNCQTAVTLTAKNRCTPIPTIANFNPIQIYDKDMANITPSALIKCWPDNTFTFNNTTARNCVPQGNTFQRQERWNFGNYWGFGHDSIVGWKPWPPTAPITISYPSVGNYNVILEDSNLCGVNTKTITVIIVNPPNAGLIAPAGPNCQGAPITFTNTSAVGYLYKWNFGDGGGFVSKPFGPQAYTYTNSGTFTVSVVALVAGGGSACTDTDKVVVTILPRPNASFSVNPNTGCDRITGALFTDLSTSAVLWNWNFGNGNTFNGALPSAQNYTTVGSFVASLTVTAANTCVHSFTAPITVYPKPVAAFSPNSACVLAAAQFTDNSTFGAGNPITSWSWNFGDASPTATTTLQNPIHTYTAPNTYTAQLIINTANCGDTALQTITINVKPTASFTYNPISGCPTLTVNFTNTSANATSYNWNFGNGNTSTATNTTQAFTNTLTTNKVYTVSLTASTGAGCADTFTNVVTIFPKPTSSFTVNAPLGCSPIAATFTNNSIGATSYVWTFGDASSTTSGASVISHTYINSTLLLQTYTAQLVATSSNGCKDSTSLTITIYPKPIFNFVMVPNSGCSPLSINFPPVLGAVSYTWDYGDGSPLAFTANPSHTFTNTTTSNLTFTVQLIASNAFSCVDTTFGYPVVYAKPQANFVHTPTVGCTPLPVSFTNSSLAGTTYLWKFGDATTANSFNANHTYTNSSSTSNQSYSCTLVAISVNGCRDSITKPILLLFKPKANFTVDTPSCSPKLLTFTNTSLGALTYNWDLGFSTSTNTNVSQQFINNTTSNITNTVQLIATSVNNCKDTLIVPIIIHPKPEFTIIANPDSGCTALKVCFPNIVGVTSYQWNFGDGNAAMTGSVCNTYYNNSQTDKTFTVQLIGTNSFGCKDTSYKTIRVFSRPIALFQANPNTVFVPIDPVNCTNLSTNATSYQWDFGDNTSSNAFSPSHNYQAAGQYQITLIATNSKGCKDTFELPSKIIALLESDVDIPNAFTPNPNGGNGGSFGALDKDNDVFHPVLRGIDKYELNIFSRWGELLFVSKDVTLGWDGYYKGKLCTQDVYVWKIIATTIDGKKINKTGDLLLLR